MPAKVTKRKSTSTGLKRKGSPRSSQTTPLRQSSRVKKPVTVQSTRPLKRKHTDTSQDRSPDSDSEFKSEKSEVQEESAATDDDDIPQSYSVPLPKAREAGDTPYEDARIHPNTFLFLKDLKANNNREWLKC